MTWNWATQSIYICTIIRMPKSVSQRIWFKTLTHNCTTSLRVEVWAHITSTNPPLLLHLPLLIMLNFIPKMAKGILHNIIQSKYIVSIIPEGLKCLYQAGKVSSHIFYEFSISLTVWYFYFVILLFFTMWFKILAFSLLFLYWICKL